MKGGNSCRQDNFPAIPQHLSSAIYVDSQAEAPSQPVQRCSLPRGTLNREALPYISIPHFLYSSCLKQSSTSGQQELFSLCLIRAKRQPAPLRQSGEAGGLVIDTHIFQSQKEKKKDEVCRIHFQSIPRSSRSLHQIKSCLYLWAAGW